MTSLKSSSESEPSDPPCYLSDGRYDDPRPDEKREEIKKLREAEDARIEAMWKAKGLKEGDEGWHKIENHAGESPLGIKWDEDNWEIA